MMPDSNEATEADDAVDDELHRVPDAKERNKVQPLW